MFTVNPFFLETRIGEDVKKILAFLGSAVMLLGLTIVPTQAASADVFGGCFVYQNWTTNCLADDANHGFCTPNPWRSAWGDTFVAAMWQLDAQTDMSDTFFSACVAHVDVGGYINRSPEIDPLPSGYLGMQLCTLGILGSPQVCDQSSIIISGPLLTDASHRRKTLCHEVGHSVGLIHNSGFGGCMEKRLLLE